jgi:hypothetical protein
MVLLVPFPTVVTGPGYLLRVQFPLDGKSFRITLPVATVQVGAVIIPTDGAAGVAGCTWITAFADDRDTHPKELVTVKLYDVPSASPDMFVVVPLPAVIIPPGFRVNIQSNVEGNPLIAIPPVDVVQVGCVIRPIIGAVGFALTITAMDADSALWHPAALVTRTV